MRRRYSFCLQIGLFLMLFMDLAVMSKAQPGITEPHSGIKPSKFQRGQIKRQYGMFIHFGINTFHNTEWSDGTLPASSYVPPVIDARQWVETAKKAGMKYVILVAKHHDGFCLWDSRYTSYDVAASGNTTNVIEAVARECRRQGIRLGLYYSLWDRKENADVNNQEADAAYNEYMLGQLNELMDITSKYTRVVEFWFDGSWTKPACRWPIVEIYKTIKQREPQCQIGINWSIGQDPDPLDPQSPRKSVNIKPADQKEGDPIRYFPSDFRLGDPELPVVPDPKIFTHKGKKYYMPFEATVCMSRRWFYHTNDTTYKSMDELVKLYKRATAQDNILILNVPPTRDGRMRTKDVEILVELRKRVGK